MVNLASEFSTAFFVIRVWAPPDLVKKRLMLKNYLKSELFHDWKTAWEHFERSRKQFDYEKFNDLYLARVNSFKPLSPQLKKAIRVLETAMSTR